MKENSLNKNEQAVGSQQFLLDSLTQQSVITHKTYHELAENPIVEGDGLQQLHLNLEQLSDMQMRLSFLMREVRYLMKV